MSQRIQKTVREETATAVEELVADMLLLRSQDQHNQGLVRRMLTR